MVTVTDRELVEVLALLAVTVWMLAADHWREWKVFQRTFRDSVEPWLTEAQIAAQQSEELRVKEEQLAAALAKARNRVPEKRLVEQFREELAKDATRRKAVGVDFAPVEAAYEALAAKPSRERRQVLLERLDRFVVAARVRQQNAERRLRFRRADFDEARSTYEAAVGEGLDRKKLDRLQQRVDRIQKDVDTLTAECEDASAHCETLTGLVAEITKEEVAAQKALFDHRAMLDRLRRSLAQQRPSLAKRILDLPMIDAFGRPLAIDQIWLPELTIDYNFCQVARFDRCTTCHQAIDKTRPGLPSDPACLHSQVLTVELATKPTYSEEEDQEDDEDDKTQPQKEPTLETVYGLTLAPRGILDRDAVTVGRILPRSLAANAVLLVGDVILKINDQPVHSRAKATEQLLKLAGDDSGDSDEKDDEGQDAEDDEEEPAGPIRLEIRRGLPHPYCSHPRLDLFVGSLSPHPLAEFGCTICHDGQGSATAFKYASHTPNDPAQRIRWHREHGWFWNQHWDFPMLPRRFAQSSCLKCHHDVTDLESGDRFPDAPAPKLLAGYHLIRQNGCFACHEIKGVDESGRRIGPDMRLEPNYAEAALQLCVDPALTDEQRALATRVVREPENASLREQLVASFLPASPDDDSPVENLKPHSIDMLELLGSEESVPGMMRKLGPSLRDLGERLDARFLESWSATPTDFRPETRMPHFFGLHQPLDGHSLKDARRFEAVELRAISEYLLTSSQPAELLETPPGVTEKPSAERGKRLFRIQGCLACHKHADFPEGQSTQGPDLSRLGAKYNTEQGAQWVTSWIRDPSHHSPRTLMPNTLLEPVPLADPEAAKDKKPKMTDPAADLAAYLLSSTGWKPKPRGKLVESDLDDLALLHLGKTFPRRLARQYIKSGIPEALAGRVQGDAVELLGKMTLQKKLRYVGRRTIGKRGCYGCHDIPGFEKAQPIGPALSDWGRKQESLLAFEQVHKFLEKQGKLAKRDPDHDFFTEAVLAKRREGFIWQKLRSPRSFDYKKAGNKGYNEHLLMGRFTLTDEEREAIVTFVLGLVAEPPRKKYVYQPDVRSKAIIEGRKVLDKYACAECHTLRMEQWSFEYDPEWFVGPMAADDFAFMKPQITPEQLAASLKTDRRGLAHAEVVGMPQVDDQGKLRAQEGEEEDEEGEPLEMFGFSLWEPAAINGEVCTVGGADVLIYEHQITRQRPPLGGTFARLLYPVVLGEAKAAGANVAGMEAWGWVPPSLVREGEMVRPAWLHDYLLEPTPIRPAAVLRMPKYNLSSQEAGKLVDYFAAVSGVEFPYSSHPRSRSSQLVAREKQRPKRLDDAMRLLVDQTTYCAKCHLIGDFSPGGQITTTLGPNLANVGRRIRPEYVRRWLANPRAALPYTGMPVNFPPTGEPIGQDLFKGSSVEQLDAVMDVLLNYEWYMSRRTSIRKLINSQAGSKPDAKANKK